MNRESEVRSRQLTAILEEVLGGGAPPDLAHRTRARLADVTPRRSRVPLLVAAAILAATGVVFATAHLRRAPATTPAAATTPQDPAPVPQPPREQEPQRKQTPEARRVTPMPQDPAPQPPPVELFVRSVDGRAEHRIGDDTFASRDAAAAALRRFVVDPAQQIEGRPRPLAIRPHPDCTWADVVAAVDLAMAAGMLDVRWGQLGPCTLIPKTVAAPADRALPSATFAEPDDDAPAARPHFVVRADGAITLDGRVLLAAGADTADPSPLRARLHELRAALAPLGERTLPPDERTVLTTPLLAEAHRDVAWRHVQFLLQLALEPEAGFHRLEYAVAAPPAIAPGKAGPTPPRGTK